MGMGLRNIKSQSSVRYRVMDAHFSAVKFENKAFT